MLVLCGLHVLTLVNTLVLMPRAHFTWTSDLDQTMSVSIPQDDLSKVTTVAAAGTGKATTVGANRALHRGCPNHGCPNHTAVITAARITLP